MASLALREALRGRRGARVLDVGCGDGFLCAVALAAGAGEVVGIDREASLVEAAARRVPGALFVWSDARQWLEREAGGGFDVVVANLPDPPLLGLVGPLAAAARFGALITTGALLWQADALARELRAAGMTPRAPRAAGGWCLYVSE
jgi:ribosomal protein L11 methylase PrmA